MEPSSTVVGINVSKAHLSVALHPSDGEHVLPNTTTSIETLVTELETIHPAVIALESTDGDVWPVVRALLNTMLPVMVVSPSRVRDVAVRTGLLSHETLFFSKTGALEARLLARFASTLRAAGNKQVIADWPILFALFSSSIKPHRYYLNPHHAHYTSRFPHTPLQEPTS
jgi:hypothetical protein